MKPPADPRRTLVRKWLERAEEDHAVAELLIAENTPYLSTSGFHLQQAAEKYLKALLVRHQIEFPKTHDLGQLLDLLAATDPEMVTALADLTSLNPYGVEARYPGDMPSVSRVEIEEALELTRQVRDRTMLAVKAYLRPSEG